ncbi:hypothetical protein [Salinactinospora qingdaonensis]|uniref:Uncharacterized protein n=1 Tax=Salinactinospora qingdaonensis TaxID=702744 RepID=A0ABP7G7R8_9ACTN
MSAPFLELDVSVGSAPNSYRVLVTTLPRGSDAVQLGVEAALIHQVDVGALLDDAAVVERVDPVGSAGADRPNG